MVSSLAADAYPTLIALGPYVADDDDDACFRFGLAILFRGLNGQVGVLRARRSISSQQPALHWPA
jgi:hypothetical protein